MNVYLILFLSSNTIIVSLQNNNSNYQKRAHEMNFLDTARRSPCKPKKVISELYKQIQPFSVCREIFQLH